MAEVSATGTGGGAAGSPVPQASVGVSLDTVMTLVRGSVVGGTWCGYERVWQESLELVSDVSGCSSNEDRLQVLLYFLGKNCEERMSIASVNKKMSGLKFMFQLNGVEDVTKAFIVHKALRGYRRGRSKPDSRWPVSLRMLTVLVSNLPQVCFSPFEAKLFRTAFVFLGR